MHGKNQFDPCLNRLTGSSCTGCVEGERGDRNAGAAIVNAWRMAWVPSEFSRARVLVAGALVKLSLLNPVGADHTSRFTLLLLLWLLALLLKSSLWRRDLAHPSYGEVVL